MPKHAHYKLGCDAHKRYSLMAVLDGRGRVVGRTRVDHERGAVRRFVSQFPAGTPVAVETVGNWYWIVDEIEAGGGLPLLAHAAKAKVMMGLVHKTDKLDAEGLGILLHNGTLPTVWIPPGELRDERELPRTRMVFSNMRTRLKNRIHSTLAKYALWLDTDSDIFTRKWRGPLLALVERLPAETARCVKQELELLDLVQQQIDCLERRILERVKITPTIRLVMSVPGPAEILSIVIEWEVGSSDRFRAASRSAAEGPLAAPLCRLQRHRPQGELQRRQEPPRADDQAGQQLPEVGLVRSTPERSGGASRRPTLWSVGGATLSGGARTSSISTNAPSGGRAMRWRWMRWLAIWRKRRTGF